MRLVPAPVVALALCGLACAAGCGGGPGDGPAPEALAYATPAAEYTQGVAIAPNPATLTNTATTFTATPALPAGLLLDAATGLVSGTPAVAQGRTTHTITAANRAGATTATLSILVRPPGHLSEKVVHFHDDAGWGAVSLLFRTGDGPWPAPPGVAMTDEGGGWFRHVIPQSRTAELAFSGGVGRVPSLAANTLRTSWEEVWIRGGLLFTADPDAGPGPSTELTILTLNLHTYQELLEPSGGSQAAKLDRVAAAIAASGADFVALQECAQRAGAAVITDPRAHLRAAEPLRADNMAFLLSQRLQEGHGLAYDYAWSWAHYGFTIYEEGVAILTRHPIDTFDDTYVSTSTSTGDPLGARKVIHVSSTLPGGRVVNLFSAHLSFGGPEQDRQLDALRGWMAAKAGNGAVASIVAGDFNMDQGSGGYLRMTSGAGGDRHVDAYWLANPEGYADATILGGQRIDHVFFGAVDGLTPLTGQVYFRAGDAALGGRVSDHAGVIVRLRLGQ